MHNLSGNETGVTRLHFRWNGIFWSSIFLEIIPLVASGNDSGCAILIAELGQCHDEVDTGLGRIRAAIREDWELPLVTM
jgi:hypothetical protein